jgi:hypothetical protein
MNLELFTVEADKHCATGCRYCKGDSPKEAGMADALRAVSYLWYDSAKDWFDGLEAGTFFTAEDMTASIGYPHPSAPGANNAVGAFISGLRKQKLVHPVGYTKATRKSSHGTVITKWVKA